MLRTSRNLFIVDNVKQIKSLMGLRFIAVLLIIVQQLQAKAIIGNFGVNFGAEAISLGLVLLGFVLYQEYYQRFQDGYSLREYWVGGWAAVWPLHAVLLLASLLVLGLAQQELPDVWPAQMLANLGLLHAWVPDQTWIHSFNGGSWVLCTVALAYIIFPLLVIDNAKRMWGVLATFVGITLLFVIFVAVLGQQGSAEFFSNLFQFNPLMRLTDFFVGVIVAIIFTSIHPKVMRVVTQPSRWQTDASDGQFVEGTDITDIRVATRKRTSGQAVDRVDAWLEDAEDRIFLDSLLEFVAIGLIAGYACLVYQVGWFEQLAQSPVLGPAGAGGLRLVSAAVVVATLVLAIAKSGGLLSRILATPAFAYLGKISFAAFMVHWLVVDLTVALGWQASNISTFLKLVVILASCVSMAMLLHHTIEVPIRRFLLDMDQEWNAEPEGPVLPGLIFRSIVSRTLHQIRVFWLSPAAWFALVVTLVCGISIGMTTTTLDPKTALVVEGSIFKGQVIEFDQEARLHGLQLRPDYGDSDSQQGNGITVCMVWERMPTSVRHRSFHLCDVDGKVIGYAQQDRSAFDQSPVNQLWIEEIKIPIEYLVNVQTVGVGFFHPQHKGAKVSWGPRGMNGRRLDINIVNRLKLWGLQEQLVQLKAAAQSLDSTEQTQLQAESVSTLSQGTPSDGTQLQESVPGDKE